MRLRNGRRQIAMKRSVLRALLAALLVPAVSGAAPLPEARATVAAASVASGSAAFIGEVLSPRNRMEEGLRVLTDEIGGRAAGSPGYVRAGPCGSGPLR